MSARRENSAIEELTRQLIEDWQFTDEEQIARIAANIPAECAGKLSERRALEERNAA